MRRTYLLASLFVSLVGVAGVAACGSSGTSASQACADAVKARCERLAACSSSDLARRFGDETTCETRETLTCLAALAAPGTAGTPETVEACAVALPSESCDDFLSNKDLAACDAQVGPTAANGACAFNAQCASQFCGVPSTALCGTCIPTPVAGSSCATIGCGKGLTCVASTMLCQVPVVAAGACSRDQPCDRGLACVGANAMMMTMGACMPQGTTAGATCDPQRKTGADCNLDDGLECDPTSKTCVAVPTAAPGGACGRAAMMATTPDIRCTAGATCVIPTGMTMGTCVAPAADGAACDSALGPGCLTPAKCIPTTAGATAGTCQLAGAMMCM